MASCPDAADLRGRRGAGGFACPPAQAKRSDLQPAPTASPIRHSGSPRRLSAVPVPRRRASARPSRHAMMTLDAASIEGHGNETAAASLASLGRALLAPPRHHRSGRPVPDRSVLEGNRRSRLLVAVEDRPVRSPAPRAAVSRSVLIHREQRRAGVSRRATCAPVQPDARVAGPGAVVCHLRRRRLSGCGAVQGPAAGLALRHHRLSGGAPFRELLCRRGGGLRSGARGDVVHGGSSRVADLPAGGRLHAIAGTAALVVAPAAAHPALGQFSRRLFPRVRRARSIHRRLAPRATAVDGCAALGSGFLLQPQPLANLRGYAPLPPKRPDARAGRVAASGAVAAALHVRPPVVRRGADADPGLAQGAPERLAPGRRLRRRCTHGVPKRHAVCVPRACPHRGVLHLQAQPPGSHRHRRPGAHDGRDWHCDRARPVLSVASGGMAVPGGCGTVPEGQPHHGAALQHS